MCILGSHGKCFGPSSVHHAARKTAPAASSFESFYDVKCPGKGAPSAETSLNRGDHRTRVLAGTAGEREGRGHVTCPGQQVTSDGQAAGLQRGGHAAGVIEQAGAAV